MRGSAALGEVVAVFADPHSNNGSDEAPAVVVRRWSGTTVNVRVLLDGTAVPWVTSVQLCQTRAEADQRASMVPPGTVPLLGWWPDS
jgi:hypothetical protein